MVDLQKHTLQRSLFLLSFVSSHKRLSYGYKRDCQHHKHPTFNQNKIKFSLRRSSKCYMCTLKRSIGCLENEKKNYANFGIFIMPRKLCIIDDPWFKESLLFKGLKTTSFATSRLLLFWEALIRQRTGYELSELSWIKHILRSWADEHVQQMCNLSHC